MQQATPDKQVYFRHDPERNGAVVLFGRELVKLNQRGQVEKRQQLPETCQGQPVISGQYLWWTGPSGIHITSLSSFQPVAETLYNTTTGTGEATNSWDQLLAANGESLFAVKNRSKIVSISVRQEPRRHLAITGEYTSDDPFAGDIVSDRDFLFATTTKGRLLKLDALSLTQTAEYELPAGASSEPHLLGDLLLIELVDERLLAFSIDTGKIVWLGNDVALACKPILLDDDRLLACTEDGEVLTMDKESGEVIRKLELTSPVSCPPLIEGDRIHFGLEEGALLTLPRNQLLSTEASP